MKTLLIHPPALFPDGSRCSVQTFYPPLGVLYIAAMLERKGFDVEVYDACIMDGGFEGVRTILKKGFDVVGISCFTALRESAYYCAQIAKEENEKSLVGLGGPHATFLAKQILKRFPFIDFIVMGEGEITFLNLIERVSSNIDFKDLPGLALRNKNNQYRLNPRREFVEDLDTLPFPARHLIPMRKYLDLGSYYDSHLRRPASNIIASRGCPGKCIFCGSPIMWGQKIRYRSPKKIVDEIEFLIQKFGVKEIFFHDDTFTAKKKWVQKFCHELLNRKIDVSWKCLGRVNTVDLETLKLMKKAGCYLIKYGVESGSERILGLMNKNIKISGAIKTIYETRKAGIFAGAGFMLGFPGETKEDILKTYELMKLLPLDKYSYTMTMIFPGTEIYYSAFEEGKLNEDIWFESLHSSNCDDTRKVKNPLARESLPVYVPNGFSKEEFVKIGEEINEAIKKHHSNRLSHFERVTKNPFLFKLAFLLRQSRFANVLNRDGSNIKSNK